MSKNLFEDISKLYCKSLEFDGFDVEANFNLGLLYLQYGQDIQKALTCFETVVTKDDNSEASHFFRA